ncbi:Pam17-domain-containing protein [Xylariaceae sp. FL0662B]|nr:Pam17-domain-containing protein [Xylariaceae sp. FL0662B]
MLTPTTTTTTTRFSVLNTRGLQLQSVFSRGATCPSSSFASLAPRQCASRTTKSISTETKSVGRRPIPSQCLFTVRRYASTAPGSSTPTLDWNTFFALRKTRRRFQVTSSVITMLIGGAAGAVLLVNMEMDWLMTKVPLDPFFSLGIITLSCAGLGWLAGPILGSAVFHAFKRGVKQPMAVKESEFFARIRKNRVDPSVSSLSGNTIPDFYGEKISSVAGYRQWLKDQRAFNKKRTSFV